MTFVWFDKRFSYYNNGHKVIDNNDNDIKFENI